MLILLLDNDDSEEHDKAPPLQVSIIFFRNSPELSARRRAAEPRGGETSDSRAEGARLGAAADRY